ncbi:PIN domain-containing protein [uncultured Xylophilus sp.]|uniref:PIN domain-containing protein n=1 Tax=uncultured Xylophilus sp. TaxID=296832 RepID=UPI0025D87D8F|nr:PIN domain-containing protein [uncultured Xylophilus sp.]
MICFFDTNILLYTVDASDPVRQEAAIACFERAAAEHTVVLSTQVLQEFYNIGTRKLRPPLSPREAQHQVQQLCAFEVIGSSAQSIQAGIDLAQQHRLSWWDALILEAALRAHADVLYTEDGTHGQKFGSLTVVNPFRSTD